MKIIKKIKSIDDGWFFSQPSLLFRIFTQSYVKGDMIVLVPFLFLILIIGIFSIHLMLLVYAVFFTIREFGEMIYWLLYQFNDKSHRPHDFGFKNLSNEAVYIIYQLLALTKVTVGIGVIILLLSFI